MTDQIPAGLLLDTLTVTRKADHLDAVVRTTHGPMHVIVEPEDEGEITAHVVRAYRAAEVYWAR
jgi:hypothetical protein